MLSIVTIFLLTFAAAFIAVRFYRAVDGWQGSRQPIGGARKQTFKDVTQGSVGITDFRTQAESEDSQSP